MKKIKSTLMFFCFGNDGINGYYKPIKKSRKKKNYKFSSVFPNEDTIERILNEDTEQINLDQLYKQKNDF